MRKGLTAAIVFLLFDLLWIAFVLQDVYFDNIPHLLRMHDGVMQANWWPALVVYILLILGLIFLVILPSKQDAWFALHRGALFGLVSYSTYGFTNLALIQGWSVWISLIDAVWGAVLCGSTAFLSVWLNRTQ